MATVLVIGYGNPLRNDDTLGWRAASELASQLSDPEVEIVACHQLNLEMAEPVSQARFVVFMDASAVGLPGEISARELSPADAAPDLHTHQLDPTTVLAAARELYGACPPAMLFSVAGESFAMGKELSAAVAQALPRLVREIKALVLERLSRLQREHKRHSHTLHAHA